VMVDADVDAVNLELVLQPRVIEEHEFAGGAIAVIDPARCRACGTRMSICRFDAIHPGQFGAQSADPFGSTGYVVDAHTCDGCAACVYACPEHAIRLTSRVSGRWFRSVGRFGPLFHAALKPGQDNSGKLVTLIKQHARSLALEEGYPLVITDGPPVLVARSSLRYPGQIWP
jgi:MinD superfamily P-loop ATPase